MSHRPGHIDNPGGSTLSMDRRKYLKALAVGTVAAGALLVESCDPKKKQDEEKKEDDHPHEPSPENNNKGGVSWGYLSLYKTNVTTIQAAIALGPPTEEEDRIIIPFFNSNGIDLTRGQVVGFHLMKIGCPPMFAIAVNLVKEDHEPDPDAETRNETMDKFLMEELKIEKKRWSPAATKPC